MPTSTSGLPVYQETPLPQTTQQLGQPTFWDYFSGAFDYLFQNAPKAINIYSQFEQAKATAKTQSVLTNPETQPGQIYLTGQALSQQTWTIIIIAVLIVFVFIAFKK
jgi:hypothetical protein